MAEQRTDIAVLTRCAPAQLAAPRLQEILMPGFVFRYKSFIGRFGFDGCELVEKRGANVYAVRKCLLCKE